ncbi:hypothetical protein SPRG_10633 [Saprolegnia parasitica CBS 223.65]|uniref:Uncharacterized protein n=1 Tax=Saprolegnia parasitica (strain CBS 223.65) TaxID=695850 RepID=A0A067C0D3_SAPPC|nr:hypothetical protein SPRG_10633 [Saprolegnia parasitica CBS 223.65]KDO24204.1 hypothetical protein SPRG_10633 [Saprolegnia parasitica CBS 223.65]|eukprot:XP_012205148.1 hypothetical protein SPRG_10633 [Saprolegnia parasitica CBS 223.65]
MADDAKSRKKQWRTPAEAPPRARSRGKTPQDATDPTPPRARPTQSNPKERTARTVAAKLAPALLEQQLQVLLTSHRFEEAASWIQSSAYLSEKYQLADVVRLVLDQRQFDLAGRLIRDLKLGENQALVTLFIKELVRSGQFNLAVRYAQELVPAFNSPESPAPRASWTPQTLIQAMIRAQQYKAALKYTKQFQLERVFPLKQLIAGLMEERAWTDAFAAIVLVDRMMNEQQWAAALKCIKGRPSVFTTRMLVERMILCGDFLPAIAAIKDFGLGADTPLLRQMLDSMLSFKELYKALKYASKFGLDTDPAYAPQSLIRVALREKQHHIAQLYIKKYKLEHEFATELAGMESEKLDKLLTFRVLMQRKRHRLRRPEYQAKYRLCLGDLYDHDEHKEEEIVSIEETIVPRAARRPLLVEDGLDDDDDDDDEVLLQKPPIFNTDDDDGDDVPHTFLFNKPKASSFLSSLHSSTTMDVPSFSDSFRLDALDVAPMDRSFHLDRPFDLAAFAKTVEAPPLPPSMPPPLPKTMPPAPMPYPPPPPSSSYQPPPPPLPSYQPPLPPPAFSMQQFFPQPPPPLQSNPAFNVASLAMQFHGQPPLPPPPMMAPPLPASFAPPQRASFVPSISLKSDADAPRAPPTRRTMLTQLQLKGHH